MARWLVSVALVLVACGGKMEEERVGTVESEQPGAAPLDVVDASISADGGTW